MAKLVSLLALAAPLASSAASLKQRQMVQFRGGNPIRKVVDLLTAMQQKVTEQGKAEQKLFDDYMCYCQRTEASLKESIEQGKDQVEKQSTAGDQAAEKKLQVEADLKAHKASRDEAKQTIATSTALREKEGAAHKKEAAEAKSNLDAMAKAIAALERSSGASFLQTKAGSTLQRYIIDKAELADDDRQAVLSFLSGASSSSEGNVGMVVGILKQMRETADKNAQEAAKAEEASQQSFQDLLVAKKKEVEALQQQIEEEQLRIGELAILAAGSSNDIAAVKRTLTENIQFLSELEDTCAARKKQWEEISKARGEELVAIAETIEVLNNDDNTDLFKKTLPSGTSFMQVEVTAAAVKSRALATLEQTSERTKISHPRLELIALALRGKKVGFEKIVAMIDDLIATLKKDQKDDDEKQAYCKQQFDQSEDKKKELELASANSEAAIDDIEGNIEKLREEIKELETGIKDLDASVSQATAQRQAEHADHMEMLSSNGAAKDVLNWAKNRLQKFYNPKLYKESLVQTTDEDELQGTEAPPEFPGAHTKSEESAGVLHLLDGLIADLDKEIQTGEIDEKHAQKNYEKMLEQARAKRAEDSQALTEKESSVAALEEGLQAEHDTKSGADAELAATKEYIQNLHNECDWLLQYYDTRKEAREGEIDGLEKGKAVLSGADFSLVQTGRSHRSVNFLSVSRQ